MKTIAIACIVLSLIFIGPASAMPTQERAKLESEIRALDKNQIHRMVLAVEGDPLSKLAEATRPTLVIYFEPIDYTVCLDQIGFLLHNEPMALQPVFWQVVFSSGDFFLQHPEESKSRLSYIAGGPRSWTSSLRTDARGEA